MSTRLLHEDPRLQRMEQAALWLQRMRDAAEDERVVEAWLDWCQRDPLNQQAFDDITAVWELSGQLSGEAVATVPAMPAAITHSRRQLLAASLAGLGLASIAGGAWWLTRMNQRGVLTSKLSSPIGVNSTRQLADGSVLELGGGTRVTVTIGPHERRVELHEGELYVSVHHEPERPFSVNVDELQVIATGTAFNVRRTSERTTVTVAEGSVKPVYEDQGSAVPNMHLQSGQQFIHFRSSNTTVVRLVNASEVTGWRSGLLNFPNNEPMSEVIATVSRYTARKIVIEEPLVKALPFTGTAHIERIEGWLRALPLVSPVTVTELADGSVLIGARAGTRSD